MAVRVGLTDRVVGPMDVASERKGACTSTALDSPVIPTSDQKRTAILARKAYYLAAIAELEARWHSTIEEMRARYLARDVEESSVDDEYVEWQWYKKAIEAVDVKLAALRQ
jgi:hypothetical protein